MWFSRVCVCVCEFRDEIRLRGGECKTREEFKSKFDRKRVKQRFSGIVPKEKLGFSRS